MKFQEAVHQAIGILQDKIDGMAAMPEDVYAELAENDPNGLIEPAIRMNRLSTIIKALRAEPTDEHPIINGSDDVDRLLRKRIAYEPQEHLSPCSWTPRTASSTHPRST